MNRNDEYNPFWKANRSLWQRLRDSRISLLLLPKIMTGDPVSVIYTRVFYRTFLTILLLSSVHYLILPLHELAAWSKFMLELLSNDPSRTYNPSAAPVALFFSVSMIYPLISLIRDIPRLPENACSTGREQGRAVGGCFILILFFATIQYSSELAEATTNSLALRIAAIVALSYALALTSLIVVRLFLFYTALLNIRKTKNSIWKKH